MSGASALISTGHRLWLRQIERFQQTHFVIAPDIPAIAKHLSGRLAAEHFDDINVCGTSAGALDEGGPRP
jgi:hypothetical protein